MKRRRRKLPTPAERLQPLAGRIFGGPPGLIPPELAEPWRAALDASHAGQRRHAEREAGYDWEPVLAALIEAGHGEKLTPPIRTKPLYKVSQLEGLNVAAFVKWLRRRKPAPSNTGVWYGGDELDDTDM